MSATASKSRLIISGLIAVVLSASATACRKAETAAESKKQPVAVAEAVDEKPPEQNADIYDDSVPADVTFTRVPEIYKRGKEEAVGKRAQIMLKYTSRPQPDWIIMTATDGSYQIAFLNFPEKFKPTVDRMQPGVPYLMDFIVTDVTRGGAPRGKVTAINRQSEFPVPNEEQPLRPAVQKIEEIRELPDDVRAERRKALQKTLHEQVDKVEPILKERARELEKEKAGQ